jgi:MFS family permease
VPLLRICRSSSVHDWYFPSIGRANGKIQGIGGGGMTTIVEILLTDMLALNERGFYTGILALVCALGTVLGPILGGAIAERATWKWYIPPRI